jgi:hypothetical protein
MRNNIARECAQIIAMGLMTLGGFGTVARGQCTPNPSCPFCWSGMSVYSSTYGGTDIQGVTTLNVGLGSTGSASPGEITTISAGAETAVEAWNNAASPCSTSIPYILAWVTSSSTDIAITSKMWRLVAGRGGAVRVIYVRRLEMAHRLMRRSFSSMS